MAKVNLTDFSGGITDFIFNAQPNQAETCDNLVITKERGLRQRYGSSVKYNNRSLNTTAINSLANFKENILINQENKLYFRSGSTFAELTGPHGTPLFTPSTTADSKITMKEWNGHLIITSDAYELPQKVYKDSSGDLQLRTAGLPKLASDPLIAPRANDGLTYLYKFVYFYQYTAGDLTFFDYGPTRTVEITNASDFSSSLHYHDIQNIPVLAGENYDDANIIVKIYRTTAVGTTFFYVGEVPNGVPTFVDSVPDNILTNNETVYTEGGVLDNDPPPRAKYVTIANETAWYANVEEDGTRVNYRVRASVQLDPDSCPTSFYVDVIGEITGIGEYRDIPIVFTKDRIYRLEGSFDLLGRGGVTAIAIHNTAGCVSNNSIVTSDIGLFWAGNDGFYWTDGYNVRNISRHIETRYKTYVSNESKKKTIYGAFDNIGHRVLWSIAENTSTTPDIIIATDLTYFTGDSTPFVTFSGGDSFKPTALLFDNGILLRGDSRGYIFEHTSSDYTDPIVDTSKDPDNWDTQPVIYTWKHIAFDFGVSDINKWVNKITVGLQNDSNLDMQLESYDDGSNVGVPLKEIEYESDLTWGAPKWIWNVNGIWRETLLISKTRRMRKGNLRTRYKQLLFTNALTTISWSDLVCTAGIDAATNRVTLDDNTLSFPAEPEGYEFRYSDGGNYSDWYEITDFIDKYTIEVDFPSTITSKSAIKWEIRGYPKPQRVHVLSIIYTYEELSDKTGGYYKTSEADGNK